MSTETTNKKIKIDNGTTFGKTYTDKAVDERLQGLVSTATFTPVKEKANNSLQKPAGLTKTELVGVGANGQENIEIGDNLTLANGKLSATGGGGGVELNILNGDFSTMTYTGTISNDKINILYMNDNYYIISEYQGGFGAVATLLDGGRWTIIYMHDGILTPAEYALRYFYHFITLTKSADNVVLYLFFLTNDDYNFSNDTLASYLEGKRLLVNGNLHGVVPTYIKGEGGVIKIYYRTPGDNNINPTPDEYKDLSSFTISELITPISQVE